MIGPKTLRKVRNTQSPMSLRDFYNKRNKIVVIRDTGGMGDILMHRMIFEDMKKMHPDLEIHFAVPSFYFDAASNHPYIDKVLDARQIDENDYVVTYKTTTMCSRYEHKHRPLVDKHRSDIWANHCGVELTNHNMHLSVSEEWQIKAQQIIKEFRQDGKPLVCFCPISASVQKDLDKWQSNSFLELIKDKFSVFALHYSNLDYLNCKTVSNIKYWEWLAILNAVDYIVTVDTGSFHAANGLMKPTVGIYSWVDFFIYGKYHEKAIMVQKHRTVKNGLSCCPCYNFITCPLVSPDKERKPCITEITGEEIAKALFELANKYPI